MIKINGLDKLENRLDDLAERAKSIEGKQSVSIAEILTPTFISGHTSFANINEVFEASGFEINNQTDFEAIPGDEWDEFIRSISSFKSWDEMLAKAGTEWAARKIGF